MEFFDDKVRQVIRNSGLYRQALVNVDEAEVRYLEVLRREVSNLLVEADPELMFRAYQRGWEYEAEVTALGAEQRLRAEEAALVAKFPRFEEFDLIGTRHFVPYSEARSWLADDQIVERYIELSKMLIIMRKRSALKPRPLFSEQEFKILTENMQRKRDRSLRGRIKEAMRLYWAHYKGVDASRESSDYTYRDAEVEVFALPYCPPENEYGIWFKKTDEYGVYMSFSHDDGREFHRYSRSDKIFKKRGSL